MDRSTQWLADYEERITRVAANARHTRESLTDVRGTAATPRGEVTVTVGPSGALEDIELTPAARAMEADRLAELIVATAREAQRDVGARVVAIMTDYVGEGPALDLVRRNLPTGEPERAAGAAGVVL